MVLPVMLDPMIKRSWLFFALLLPLVAACPLHAQDSNTPPKRIDVSHFTSSVDEVVIPVPSEIFNALDKLGGSPNWSGVLPSGGESKFHPKVQAEIALLLGNVIADGFISVEAKDSTRVEGIGRRVIELANSLGVGKSVISHCNAISEAAKKDQWEAVRTELDRTQNSVRDAMKALHSKDESELVSIAGWLRGTDALTTLIKADYKPDRADLLHQPDMLETFDKQMNGMSESVKADKMVTGIRDGLKKIKVMVTTKGDEPIPADAVTKINDITTELVKTVAP